jgi:hypothetical protein
MRNLSRLFLLGSVCAALGVVQASQKQSYTVAAPLSAVNWSVIAPPVNGVPVPLAASLTQDQAANLVNAVFTAATINGSNHAIMVHAVKYLSGKLVAAEQNWYAIDLNPTPLVETLGDLHASARYKDPRIFGRPHLGVVYLHILEAATAAAVEGQLRGAYSGTIRNTLATPPATPALSAAEVMAADASNSIATIINLDPGDVELANLQDRLQAFKSKLQPVVALDKADLQAGRAGKLEAMKSEATILWNDITAERITIELLNKGVSGQITLTSTDGTQLVPWNGYYLKTGFDALSSLAYSIDITSKEKAPLSNLKQIIGLAIGAQSVAQTRLAIALTFTPFAAGGVFDTTLTTSDVVVTANYSSAGKDTQIGTQTYDNEGRYLYDFTLALPIKSYNDLSYDSTANGLTARTIQKNNLYAAFNFGLPRDTKNMKFQLVPVLMYGIPITGQPLKHHLFAGSVGLNYVNFFVGATLDGKDFYHDFSQPLTGANVFRVWRTHLTYGINFDVATIVKALTKTSK